MESRGLAMDEGNPQFRYSDRIGASRISQARMERSNLARWQKCDPEGAKFAGSLRLELLANIVDATVWLIDAVTRAENVLIRERVVARMRQRGGAYPRPTIDFEKLGTRARL
jgi:hypothetical protein